MSNPFSPDALQKATHATLSEAFQAIPEGKRGALLVLADRDGASVQLAAKIGDHWQLAAGGSKPWNGPVSGTVAIAGSW